MFNCAECQNQECQTRNKESLNPACPMLDKEIFEEIKQAYHTEEIQTFYANSLKSMRGSFGRWTRIKEIMEFCKYNGFTKIGLAYCSGMLREGRLANEILRQNGFIVVAAGCKVGGFAPDELCEAYEAPPAMHFPSSNHKQNIPRKNRAICDPIGQAIILNKEKTEFNILVGLCVGHDSLFLKFSDAPCSVLVAKDRLLNNNPVAALYCHEEKNNNL